ncbi:hypothetical protein B4915_03175 [Leucobacter massiliensis]|uniref:Clp R domain-containing protein n=2 Tax=Leucobacter massiliensis TaxID=1686285 RepID=A0A2S9QRR8_9MICO|nr:hypothetical protein B4915_03175 [Leucobacter massiliensis]
MMAAIVEAQRRGFGTVEAEDLLLAIAADTHTATGRFLAERGLDHAGVAEALRVERERSLGSVGVAPRDPATLVATRLGRPKWTASLRTAFERAQKVAALDRRGRHRMTAFDLLAGVLQAELGTVPRALAYAGIDRVALLAELAERSSPDSG